MPKIIIKEYDNTKAGTRQYSNFSVVVPGYAGANYDEEKFDDNGVYECSSAADFIKYVGAVEKRENQVVAVPAKPRTALIAGDSYEPNTTYYTWKKVEGAVPGHFVDKDSNKYTVYNRPVGEDTCPAEMSGKITTLENTGIDGEGGDLYSIGNQIAYELLSQGYTVLYKLIPADKSVSELDEPDFWSPLRDKSIYDFRYIMTGLINGKTNGNEQIEKLVNFSNKVDIYTQIDTIARGDAIALVDINEEAYKEKVSMSSIITSIKDAAELENEASKYTALFAPYVIYKNLTYKELGDSEKVYTNKHFPGSFHYLACASKASEKFAEWYAISGLERGLANSRYTIDGVGCTLGEIAVDYLQPRAIRNDQEKVRSQRPVNLIIKNGSSYYLWGNRTAEYMDVNLNSELTAKNFLNIRQLCCSIKKQVYQSCRQFTFDPNSDILWVNFYNSITPLLERMKADQGIGNYQIYKAANDKKAVLAAVVRIVPYEAVEDFDISITLEDSIQGTVEFDED